MIVYECNVCGKQMPSKGYMHTLLYVEADKPDYRIGVAEKLYGFTEWSSVYIRYKGREVYHLCPACMAKVMRTLDSSHEWIAKNGE